MADLQLVLFDDARARSWEPFALTRPAGELLFGTLTLRERAERVFRARCAVHLVADHLLGFEEEGAPPVALLGEAPADGDRLFWLARAVPDWAALEAWTERRSGPLSMGGEIVGWYAPAGTPAPGPELLLRPAEAGADPVSELPGRVLGRVWELVSENTPQIAVDIGALHPSPAPADLGPHVYQWGEHPVIIGEGVRLEPGSAFDTTDGPIWLDQGAVVRAFTRLCGPAYIGPRSVVLGGSVSCVSVGPVCRIRGEIADSVCVGYVNKQHDGHLGHAYLGRWVNLGAGTHNSDLKNNYSSIRLWTPEGDMDTGTIKMGSLLGDHVKTGIGLLFNTGTVVGAGSNLYGAAMPPKMVPPFSWGTGDDLVPFRLDKFLEVAERAMERRDVMLGGGARSQLERAWQKARGGVEPEPSTAG